MRKNKGSLLRLSLLFILVIIASVIFTCCIPLASDYAASYLDSYDVPSFDKSKLREVERVYMKYYVEKLPSPSEMAEKTASVYFDTYHEKINTDSTEAVTEAVIKSYVLSIGDKYSVYRNAEEYAGYDTEMSGSFFGIGVVVTQDSDGMILINEVYSGSGADDAGLLPGDVVVAVAGKSVSEIGYEDAVDLIRGDENTQVKLTVKRAGVQLEFSVERRRVVEQSVTYAIDANKIGYVTRPQ